MKKFFILLLVLCMICPAALAETKVNLGENRNITINPSAGNTVPEGISPVTGRDLNELDQPNGFAGQAITGRYMPILMQIDNANGGISNSAGKRSPWGVEYADIIYEAPLYRAGDTRLTFLFNDLIPTAAGPCRSARIVHAWLREEWDAGFIFYGQQTLPATSVPAVFHETGADKKGWENGNGLLFCGTDGTSKPWKKNFSVIEGLASPHNRSANVAAMYALIDPDFEPLNRAFKFADELPTEGEDASLVYINWNKNDQVYNSLLEWDEDDECYYRYMLPNGKEEPYVDVDSQEYITFSNVIVQALEGEWVQTGAFLPTVLGTGNAEIFIGGKHIAGVWNREALNQPTVFYDENGEEVALQPGRTLICLMDYNTDGRGVSFE